MRLTTHLNLRKDFDTPWVTLREVEEFCAKLRAVGRGDIQKIYPKHGLSASWEDDQ